MFMRNVPGVIQLGPLAVFPEFAPACGHSRESAGAAVTDCLPLGGRSGGGAGGGLATSVGAVPPPRRRSRHVAATLWRYFGVVSLAPFRN